MEDLPNTDTDVGFMRITNNINAKITQGAMFRIQRNMSRSIERLSTGLRINRASDDAAGLGISENLRSQVRGNLQAMRNVQDAISLLNVGEGGLERIHEILQRSRELAIQASNDTLTETERGYLNQELTHLVEEVDRITETTTFNDIKVLSSTVDSDLADAITLGLQQTWLSDAADLVGLHYGLDGSGADLTVHLENGISGAAAYVSFTQAGQPLELHIDTSSSVFDPGYVDGTDAEKSGGTAPFHSDRIIAHEMVHALMGDQITDAGALPTWFHEGMAEYIHGADERLATYVGTNPDAATGQAFVDANPIGGAWTGSSEDYATSYAAIKYLESRLDGGKTLSDVIQHLEDNGGNALDGALQTHASGNYAGGVSDFIADYNANGGAFIAGLNLADADTGAIGGGDRVSVVSNGGGGLPAADFNVQFEPVTSNLKIQADAAYGDGPAVVEISTTGVSASNLGIDDASLTTQKSAVEAITKLSDAVDSVSRARTKYGSYVVRFEHTLANLHTVAANQQYSESLIRDADYAETTAEFTRAQILSQSSTAMLSQANMIPQGVLQLFG